MTSAERAWPPTPATPPPDARLVTDVVEVDLTAGGSFLAGVPHDAFDALRRRGGVAWHAEPPVVGLLGDDNPLLRFVDSPGFWVVTSHALDRDQAPLRPAPSQAGGQPDPRRHGLLDAAVQSVFDIHQTGHGHALSESGLPILMLLDDMKAEVGRPVGRDGS